MTTQKNRRPNAPGQSRLGAPLGLVLLLASACGDDTTGTAEDTTGGTDDPTSTTTLTTSPSTTLTTGMTLDDTGDDTTGDDTTGDDTADDDTTGTGTTGDSSDDTTGDTMAEECGNGVLDPGEQCDGSDLDGTTCTDLRNFVGGDLACDPETCQFDVSMCVAPSCNDGTIDPGEDCDGDDLGGATCESLGFSGGTLICNDRSCTFDSSGCYDGLTGDTCELPHLIDPNTLPFSLTGHTEDYTNNYAFLAGDCPTAVGGNANGGANDVVFSFTPNVSGIYTMIFDVSFDGIIYIVTDCADTSGTCVQAADAAVSGGETLYADLEAGTTYFVIAGHWATSPGSETFAPFTFSVEECTPTVCDGTYCGTDGCGGTCSCADGDFCDAGTCAPSPDGYVCTAAIDLTNETFPFTATGTFDDDPAVGGSCDTTPNNTVWFTYTAPTTGDYAINAQNFTPTAAFSRLAVFETDSCDPLGTQVSCTTAASTSIGASVPMSEGTTYTIMFYTDGNTYTMVDPQISIVEVDNAGNTCAAPLPLESGTYSWQFATNDFVTGGAGGCTGFAANGVDRVHEVTLAAGDTLTVTLTASAGDPSIYLITDCSEPATTCVVGSDNGGAVPETIVYQAPADGTYFFIADRWTSGATSATYTLDVDIQ